jgi:CheY-like chemotaxis protein
MFKAFSPGIDEPRGASEAWTGGGTILVVDDEEMVRDVAQMMLESFGFSVVLARDGIEGLRNVVENANLDAVLLDLTMPKMNGEETFREMHKVRPELPVILVSGYNEQEVTDQFIGQEIAGFIQKPFQRPELMAKLRQVLEKR